MKRRNFRFPVSPGNAEALARWGGKIKYALIAHFLGNIFANNCCNRTLYVQITAIGYDQDGLLISQKQHRIVQLYYKSLLRESIM